MKTCQPISIPDFLDLINPKEDTSKAFLTTFEEKFSQIEAEIQAFIPEQNRFVRLRSELYSANRRGFTLKHHYPLLGLLFGVKDIFHAEGFATQAGSQLPPILLSGHEANCVTTLKNLGAFVLGKTITTEFAYFAPGPTKNPHNLAYTPGGSSSGSAAAVAAGLTPFAFGSQTIGSIIRPASYCGVVGFKPTYGRVSSQGVIPLAPSVDTVGFFTVNVPDALFIASYLCENWHIPKKETSKPVLGIPVGPYLDILEPEMYIHFQKVCLYLSNHGYQIFHVPTMNDFPRIAHHHNLLVAYEAAQIHKSWFAKYEDRYDHKTAELIQRGQSYHIDEYRQALISCHTLRHSLTSLMDSSKIDLWISPSAQGPPPYGLENTGNPIMNLPWTHCGFPTLNVPSGQNRFGLPLGLQISARWHNDEKLLIWGTDIAEILITSK